LNDVQVTVEHGQAKTNITTAAAVTATGPASRTEPCGALRHRPDHPEGMFLSLLGPTGADGIVADCGWPGRDPS